MSQLIHLDNSYTLYLMRSIFFTAIGVKKITLSLWDTCLLYGPCSSKIKSHYVSEEKEERSTFLGQADDMTLACGLF